MQEHSLFSTTSPAVIVCRFFDDNHPEGCEVMPHCSFDLHFPNNEMLSIEIYTLPYVKFGNLLFDTGSSNLVLCDNLEVGWSGRWEMLKRQGTCTCPCKVSMSPVGDCG